MKYVYLIPLICLSLAMGCQRNYETAADSDPAPATVVPAEEASAPAPVPTTELPKGDEQTTAVEVPDFQDLKIVGRPFESLFQLRDDVISPPKQKSSADEAVFEAATSGNLDDLSLARIADELTIEIERKKQEFEEYFNGNSVEISLIIAKNIVATQSAPFVKQDGDLLMTIIPKESLDTSTKMIELEVDMSYDLVCKLKDATKAYKKEKKQELKPSLRMSLKSVGIK
jgi:hypothetical protein